MESLEDSEELEEEAQQEVDKVFFITLEIIIVVLHIPVSYFNFKSTCLMLLIIIRRKLIFIDSLFE